VSVSQSIIIIIIIFCNGPFWLVLHKFFWYFDIPQTLAFSTNVLMGFYFVAMGHLVGISPKQLWNPLLSPSKNHIFFHNWVKSYKCQFFTLTNVLHDIKQVYIVLHLLKFHYEIYTYMKFKSKTVYMHNIDLSNYVFMNIFSQFWFWIFYRTRSMI